MSSTIVDLVEYGNVKVRDVYSRNIIQAVKGDGVNCLESLPNILRYPVDYRHRVQSF